MSRSPRKQTLRQLQELQRLAASVIMRPLGPGMRIQRAWTDGRPTSSVAEKFIKPNDRLTSLERVEIYNRQYWFRLVDCLYEDYPGLLSVIGQRRFDRLICEYLEAHPSRSYTLRNLGSRLPSFVEKNPALIGPRHQMARDMARFEWAQILAFDGPENPPLSVDDLLGVNPAKLRLGLQPFITLLEMSYPLDDYSLALKKQQTSLRGEASNAMEEEPAEISTKSPRIPLPKLEKIFVAVHRQNNDLYFKRLEPLAYKVLAALRDARSLAAACSAAPSPDHARRWFENWTALGWFCKPSR